MTTSAQTQIDPAFQPVWEDVGRTLTEVRSAGDAFEKFADELFQELLTLQQSLASQKEELHRQGERLNQVQTGNNEDEIRLADELKQSARHLAQSQRELTDARREVERERDKHREEIERLQSELARQITMTRQNGSAEATQAADLKAKQFENALKLLQAERDSLRNELEMNRQQSTQLSGVTVELADARVELANVRAELTNVRTELQRNNNNNQQMVQEAGARRDDLAALQLQKRVLEMEQERSALEAELETIRKRTAELVDASGKERQKIEAERQEWGKQLQELRESMSGYHEALESVKTKSDSKTDRAEDANAESPETERKPKKSVKRNLEEVVLNRVMAQFESLQRDIKKRRTEKEERQTTAT